MDRGARATLVGLAVAAVVFGLPMFAVPDGFVSGDLWRTNDWLNTRMFDMLARAAIVEHGVFPLRSPLVGGGFPTLAHPSDGSWAPTMLVILACGHVLGTKVLVLLFLYAGAAGVFLVARDVLRLSVPAAGIAAGLMLVSGWAPSMLLVGFWNQIFSLLAPLILWCLLRPSPRRLLVGGFLLAMVLQQGGHAFSALCVALGLTVLATAAHDARSGGRAAAALLATTAPLAFAAVGGVPWLAVLSLGGPALLWSSAELRAALLPRVRALAAILGVALALGAARLAGLWTLSQLGGRYGHALSRHDALWFPDRAGGLLPSIGTRGTPSFRGGQFYDSVGTLIDGLVHRVPGTMPYREEFGRLGAPMDFEYAWIGLSWVGLALLVLGLGVAWRQRRWALLALWSGALAICLGPHLPPDLHFLVVGGLPWVGDLAQPLKYWNVFVLLASVLVAGVGVHGLLERGTGHPTLSPIRRWLPAALALTLLWPAFQNRAALGEAFSQPRSALDPTRFGADPSLGPRQLSLIGDLAQSSDPVAAVAADVERKRLREYRRAPTATGYDLAQVGVGLISWYGTLELPERTIPDVWVTPEGATAPNPSAIGPMSLDGGGLIASGDIGPNEVTARVVAPAGALLVINQEALAGARDWDVTGGVLVPHDGLLAVRLNGEPDVRLVYRPRLLRAGLTLSGIAGVLWTLAFAATWRRRVQTPP